MIEFNIISQLIVQARNNALKTVNAGLVNLYWQVGAFVSNQLEQAKWGEKTVQQLSDFLLKQDPTLKGFDRKNIYRMIQFFETYRHSKFISAFKSPIDVLENSSNEIVATLWRQFENTLEKGNVATLWRQINESDISQTLLAKVNWSIHKILIARTHSSEEREFYIKMCIKENYSVKELDRQISASLFERTMLGSNNNLSTTLKRTYPDIAYTFKDSYVFEFLNLHEKPNENPSIGVLLCKDKDIEVVEYALGRNLSPALIAEYKTQLPDKKLLQQKLHELFELNNSGE